MITDEQVKSGFEEWLETQPNWDNLSAEDRLSLCEVWFSGVKLASEHYQSEIDRLNNYVIEGYKERIEELQKRLDDAVEVLRKCDDWAETSYVQKIAREFLAKIER